MPASVSPLTLNRLSFYLRCLRRLHQEGEGRVSSQGLAQFGEFGIRGVGYEVEPLIARLSELLGLDRRHRIVIVGMGNLGSALSRYLGFNSGAFRVVAGVDRDPDKVGREVGGFTVAHTSELRRVVRESGAEIGVLSVPADAAQQNYDALVEAGVQGVLNFSPTRIRPVPEVSLKDVDLRIHLEELAFFLK